MHPRLFTRQTKTGPGNGGFPVLFVIFWIGPDTRADADQVRTGHDDAEAGDLQLAFFSFQRGINIIHADLLDRAGKLETAVLSPRGRDDVGEDKLSQDLFEIGVENGQDGAQFRAPQGAAILLQRKDQHNIDPLLDAMICSSPLLFRNESEEIRFF